MEEAQKRRERLKAMRSEADGAAVDANVDRPGFLANPFAEGESTSAPTQYSPPRFDFYTDPIAAFSGTRRDSIAPQVPHGRGNMLPRPTYQSMTPGRPYQAPGFNPPDQRMYQVPGAPFNQSPPERPMGFAPPSGRPQGNPPNSSPEKRSGPAYQSMTPEPSYRTPGVNSPDQRIFQGQGAQFNQIPPGRPVVNPPNPWDPSNMPRGGNFGNPGFVQEEYPYNGRGRGQRYYDNSHYESGRGSSRYNNSGRGRGRSFSPGSRTGGTRGGSHESVSAEVRPDLYYRKEMVEDPWKTLTPVIWKDTRAKGSDKSWLPKSITMKKAKVSTEVPQSSISQQSLAQYLASSFSDPTDEPDDREPSV